MGTTKGTKGKRQYYSKKKVLQYMDTYLQLVTKEQNGSVQHAQE